jgi:hypothetical protein
MKKGVCLNHRGLRGFLCVLKKVIKGTIYNNIKIDCIIPWFQHRRGSAQMACVGAKNQRRGKKE